MRLLRRIGRAAPWIAAAAAAAWYLRRRLALPEPSGQGPEPDIDAIEALSDAADVPSVVEDLLAAAPDEELEPPPPGPRA